MPSIVTAVQLTLPRRHVGQILDGLEVLIEQWDATAAWFRTGEVGDIPIRECSDAEEAESIAGHYREIAAEIRRQMADAGRTTTRDGSVLDLDAMVDALAADPDLRERLCAEYGLPNPASADDFVSSLVEAFDQRPHEDPLGVDRSPRDVFRAAIWSLGSNSRAWTNFLRRERELAALLEDYDPDAVHQKVADGQLSAQDLLDFFPGQTRRTDARSVIAWARRASTRDFDREVRALAGALTTRSREEQGEEIRTDHLMPSLVAFLAYPPSGRWPGYDVLRAAGVTDDPADLKLPGMGPALGSELFRNLGWSGFKPDRHIMRLLDRWAPEVVEAQRPVAERLAKLVGRRDRATLDYLAYSLAGQKLTPEGTHFSVADNLTWALGAYVEKKGRESGRRYIRSSSR